jgi:hypothetical protein
VNFIGTIFNDYKSYRNFLMEENPGKLYFMTKILLLSLKTDFFLNASKGQCFLQFLHSSRPGSTRFGASVGCWKRCFQGYEYKKCFFVRHCQNLRIFSYVNGFDKCHNLSKRNVKLILKVLSDLELLRGSSNKKTLYSTRLCVNWAFFDTRGPLKRSFHSRFKMAHACQKSPNLHTNSSNKLLFRFFSNEDCNNFRNLLYNFKLTATYTYL